MIHIQIYAFSSIETVSMLSVSIYDLFKPYTRFITVSQSFQVDDGPRRDREDPIRAVRAVPAGGCHYYSRIVSDRYCSGKENLYECDQGGDH